jgi:hypothetical protein
MLSNTTQPLFWTKIRVLNPIQNIIKIRRVALEMADALSWGLVECMDFLSGQIYKFSSDEIELLGPLILKRHNLEISVSMIS